MRLAHGLLLAVTLGCGHEDPWSASAPNPLGPVTAGLPRRLTFNSGDDRAPALWADGGLVAFARFDPVENAKPCIAYLPAEGGTLAAMHCPPPRSPADTFETTWGSPVLSTDGRQVAFLWQRAGTAAELAAWTSELVIAPRESPQTPVTRVNLQHFLPEGFATSMMEPVWHDAGTIRLLAAYDSIWKVKGGGAERFTDTLLVPRRLVDVDPASGLLTPVPGSDSAVAWTPRAAGGFWIIRAPNRLLDVTAGVAVPRGLYAGPVTDIAEVQGAVVAALGDTLVEWIDAQTGARGTIAMPGPVRRVAPAGGRRVVAEVERGVNEFGQPANLWLFEIP
jgi:hypothetical protein